MKSQQHYRCVWSGLVWSAFFCTSFLLTAPGVRALKFLQDPRLFQHSYVGFTIDFNCTTDDPNARVSLLQSKDYGSSYSVLQVLPNKLLLRKQVFTIVNLILSDGAHYKCRATDQSGQTIEWPDVQLSVGTVKEPKLEFIPNKQPIYVLQGKSGEVTCAAELPSISTLKWEKQQNDKSYAAVPNSQVNITEDAKYVRATLKITNAQFADTGTYKCTVQYPPTKSKHKEIKITVLAPSAPSISPYTGQTDIREGSTMSINCVAEGFPKPTVDWYRNGKKLNVTNCHTKSQSCDKVAYEIYEDGSSRLHHIYTYQVLRIRNVSYPRDVGDFKCVASNGLSPDAELIVSLDVQVKPTLEERLDAVVVVEDKAATVSCKVTRSNPLPLFSWQYALINLECDIQKPAGTCVPKEDKWITVPCNLLLSSSSKPTNESIVKVPKDHQNAFYRCQASNFLGDNWQILRFVRLVAPVIVEPKEGEASLLLKIGDPLNISCVAKGNPAPNVTWLNNNTGNAVSTTSTNSQRLIINSIEDKDFGFYTCIARSKLNYTTVSVEIKKVSTSSNPNLSPIEVLSKEATVAFSVVGAILFLCIVLGFAFFCYIRHQRKQIMEYRHQLFPVYTGKHQIDPNRTLLEQCNDLPYDPDFEFPEDKLILGEVLGSGAFGKVIKAEAIGINNFSPRDKSQKKSQRRPKMFRQYRAGHAYHDPRGSAYTKTTVAVKTVRGGATAEEVRDLASELKILIYIGEHKNIVNLLGACIKRDRILVILEYAPHGSLQKFLQGKRDVYEATWTTTASDPEIRLNISNLVGYAYQISRGMEYLASKKCVHRDLAARNVLVGKDYVMKIADFGLARDIYKSDLYVKTNSGFLPMKWMAIESLFLREYSEKSDVWSFGICLWEIFTLGGTPYPTIPVEELRDFLNYGNRMENPRDCPSEIYKIMQDCWQEGPDKRPKFDQISQSIGTILEQRASQSVATEYLHLIEDNNRGRKDYYLEPHDSDPTVPVTRADVYNRRSSENIANNPLPPLPDDMEDQFDPESEERQQKQKPEIYGGLSGSEGDIKLEEFHGNDQAVALELTPIAHSKEKAGNSKNKTTIV